jgi:hypothetical protein
MCNEEITYKKGTKYTSAVELRNAGIIYLHKMRCE